MFGIVVIGRNEGDRLKACFKSAPSATPLVYVDSGSTDGSTLLAREFRAEVIDLDLRSPFTAARARNAGFQKLQEAFPTLKYVQFVDGDCVICTDWLEQAVTFLETHHLTCAVFGRRRERYPDRSVYNKLCDLEWDDVPLGEAGECGGDVMMRIDALAAVGGYRADLIAGEEPELCLRLQRAGWIVWRIDAEMTLHDAAITRLTQWWKRTVRNGYALEQGAALHGSGPERYRLRASRRTWLWGFWAPIIGVALTAFFGVFGVAFFWFTWLSLPAYCIETKELCRSAPSSLFFFQVLGRIPESLGQLKYLRDRMFNQQTRLIEYK